MNRSPGSDKKRFDVVSPHFRGAYAVIDTHDDALIAVTGEPSAAESAVTALNAATDPNTSWPARTDALSKVDPSLGWRVVDHLSTLRERTPE